MNTKKENKNKKKPWIQYGIFAIVAISLYTTGLHTEVIGFAQRGLLATGLMNPDIEEIAQVRKNDKNNDEASMPNLTKADLNLKLIDAEGKKRSLKEFKDKVIFLNFWATWCPPCIAEMPTIDKLHEEMGDEVAFILLSFDDDFEKAKAFNKRKGYDLPIYAPASNLPAMFQSSALPTTYVIDADGNMALTHKGMADYSDPKFKDFILDLKK
ncbi:MULTISPECIES: TlpA family protein disulfide reductase [Croceibacter]|jgi:thiol-disulfide isomerase/thioredoxin|uniref:Thioredoxin, putative n=1 Tax=Croceibacter atlanticus (strain ATCC BAA-628 / JCM 21780 / CIP 108009 / IAM 15332 / KCTC 12090 / HTCC2559) TaxID=216432 RepID=A3UA84_CROAH|nr:MULTISPECIES: TlpA disulfide reductase family protein [Croceibacter]EAP86720.1 thioredoxin, putative [Croceibacter atlanticus HTCC2559]MAO26035.1 TlpA family protein disulfide reductase [Roseovarius sp.]MBG25109.1 TlpA family protein disulfide reductase [Croceibacter sp.]MBW4970844.1 TlpA family protein disulfide reductase [Croceibacter atlanticus]|tara:strand:+ start:298 stop:933 length:636 start_codon:yes stop_codon:yes gene_type:complete